MLSACQPEAQRDVLEATNFVGEGPRRMRALYDELWVAGPLCVRLS